MTEIIQGSIYDYPKYYDLLFGSDVTAEFNFFKKCFPKHAGCAVKRVFEPACGTGRLLIKLAKAGFEVGGNDLNEKAINFCNDRLERFGFGRTTLVQDMTDFKVKKKFDAAFNTINSFRHLATEKQAEAHLHCMAAALNKGGLYILGIHLDPTNGERMQEESWSARRGNLAITSYMWSKGVEMYKHAQFKSLMKKVPEFEIAEVYDFAYDINQPLKITPNTEDVVFILRKK
jgi:cyclopropane fatty-acyl-phospholipid synthase-like methyltransferase